MATRSTIMDTNSFRPEMADALDPATRKLTEERDVLGPAYRLFYRNPVHLVKGVGSHLWDADGEEYLDVYNNVASVGHCHPRVVEALSKQPCPTSLTASCSSAPAPKPTIWPYEWLRPTPAAKA